MFRAAGKAKKVLKSGAGMVGASDLLTAGKLAQAWGVTPADVKKAVASAGVHPDVVRCGCAYYGKATAASIKKHLAKA